MNTVMKYRKISIGTGTKYYMFYTLVILRLMYLIVIYDFRY